MNLWLDESKYGLLVLR